MANRRNPNTPQSDVRHVFFDVRRGLWHLHLTSDGEQHDDWFSTREDAEAAMPSFVRTHGSGRQIDAMFQPKTSRVGYDDMPARSDVPHTYEDRSTGGWNLVICANNVEHTERYATRSEAEAEQPSFVERYGTLEQRERSRDFWATQLVAA